ncbi:PREDICTED: prolyl 4-hydroxylase subunit alpha-1 [Bactrocera latifrons]|uniref:procollagen-proline 4-dioxygenase n=1 Tax=Bactrocera latifrons TaxID=174628 RepID=A0A0K8VAT0_BACLA|nr:PREDICTED: prolyl 4-hydroxylase subunit alpha-1 [Bactrocera latifrons]
MSKMHWTGATFLLIVVSLLSACSAQIDYFSSISGLENLLRTEEYLLQSFREYVRASKHQLQTLESELHRIEMEYAQAARNTENYLTNPVNVYRLMKRLTTDWTIYEERVQSDEAANTFLRQMVEFRETLSFPSAEDFKASAAALARLQETYHLDTAQIAGGFLNGVKYGTSMTWQDCFVLGKQLFHLEEYNHTKLWLKESMQRLSREPYYKDPHTLEYVEDVAKSLLNLGDLETALKLSDDVLSLDPTRATASYVRNTILSPVGERKPTLTTSPSYYHQTEEFERYKKVCRGEITASPTQLRPLRCHYESNNHPYRFIAPFKVEEHSLDPLVLTLHDFIDDTKIETIKYLATPYMQRSTVRDVVTLSKATDFRISKNAWLAYQEHTYMQDMLRDLHDLTGLDVTRCEKLQVANYGLGGHYEPHWDFYLDTERLPEGLGNRIATAIFYLSEVEQGGATAFPNLNFAIKPKKGNVLFWYNLHRSLEGDYRTRHAACPVLKGSKWIGNVWINAITQPFTRPCLLHKDDAISKPYFTIV